MEILIALPIIFFLLILIRLFRNMSKNKEPSDIMALNLSPEEYYKSLNFMLMYGIITAEEYNKFLAKGSPYLG